MKIKNIFIIFFEFLLSLLNSKSDFKKYDKLKINDVASIKIEDLPEEFGKEAFKTIDEFIKKTAYLNHEWLLYFDYKTGEILRCIEGKKDEVKITFENDEFEGYHVASIHNHPLDVISPPSGKNFGILLREFEEYELIASKNELWILKAKPVDIHLANEINLFAIYFFNAAEIQADNYYDDEEMKDKYISIAYGESLLNYINDKNIKDIQLTKKRYEND